jgi:uncharacterized membrane protein
MPLNDELEAVGAAGGDLAAIRAKFESTWVGWNLVRAVGCTAALGCLIRALAV